MSEEDIVFNYLFANHVNCILDMVGRNDRNDGRVNNAKIPSPMNSQLRVHYPLLDIPRNPGSSTGTQNVKPQSRLALQIGCHHNRQSATNAHVHFLPTLHLGASVTEAKYWELTLNY